MSTTPEDAVAVGIPPEEGKFCADCKYLIGIRLDPHNTEYWKCGHPNNSKWKPADLVTGIKEREFRFNIRELRYLNTVDSAAVGTNLCGREGRWYEKYDKPDYTISDRSHESSPKERPVEYKPQTMKPSALKNLQLGKDL